MKRVWLYVSIGAVVVGIIALVSWVQSQCLSARFDHGMRIPECPDGNIIPKLKVDASGLMRGAPGQLNIEVVAVYTEEHADEWLEASINDFEVSAAFVDNAGNETPLKPDKEWHYSDGSASGNVTLPEVTDGDYILRTRLKSSIGDASLDLPLALYAPATVHVLTDRPLYEPGNQINFRAVVLRANDLSPIDHRPGEWIVKNPAGEPMLEEKAPAGEWGVVAGSFPLAADADSGTWTVSWRSGAAEESVSVRVEPFTLPRFRVDAASDKPFYGSGDNPLVSGQVVYSSGAPVPGAALEMTWNTSGSWPPPLSWQKSELPKTAKTGPDGTFELALPTIPADLQGQVDLVARISAVDRAGDRVDGSVSVLLSEDKIKVEAQTELDGGLVDGFNNRMYMRVTTADGQPLPGAKLVVTKAWVPGDKGIESELDADSVARLQVDPGKPVTIVVPPPVRRKTVAERNLSAPIVLNGASDLLSGSGATVADQVAMETWLSHLAPCAKWQDGSEDAVTIGMHVSPAGSVVSATADSPIERCLSARLRTRRLPAGKHRFLTVAFGLREANLPTADVGVTQVIEVEGVDELFAAAALDARDCLPRNWEGLVPRALSYTIRAKTKTVQASWIDTGEPGRAPPSVEACLLGRLRGHSLEEPAEQSSFGFVRYDLESPDIEDEEPASLAPQPTTMRGYELLVSAVMGNEVIGETTLRMSPGSVPPLRLRVTPVLAQAGDDVKMEVLRGPDFSGDLPEDIQIEHNGNYENVKLDKETRSASYKIPDGGHGWFKVSVAGVRALVYARGGSDLAVALSPDKKSYAPGSDAVLDISTTVGGKGAKAAVGLIGVDNSLAQLAPLPGADDMRRIRPEISMSRKAFGVLDATALTLGRIRGSNAAEATIMRVTSVPEPPVTDNRVYVYAETSIDPVEDLTDRFYTVLLELNNLAREWEKNAPEKEKMNPETMAKLWTKAVNAVAAAGKPVQDAFGRKLRLHRLPDDLLALTDPRQVVVIGTRLPEDVENWADWVRSTRP